MSRRRDAIRLLATLPIILSGGATSAQRAIWSMATEVHQWPLLARRIEENHARLEANGVTLTPADKVTANCAPHSKAASGAIAGWKSDVGPEAAALLR